MTSVVATGLFLHIIWVQLVEVDDPAKPHAFVSLPLQSRVILEGPPKPHAFVTLPLQSRIIIFIIIIKNNHNKSLRLLSFVTLI